MTLSLTQKHSIPDYDIIQAVRTSVSIREVLEKLDLSIKSSSCYLFIYKKIEELQLDKTHITGQSWSKNKRLVTKYPIEDYLSNRRKIQSHSLKKRLIKEGIFKYCCSNCNLSEWLSGPIPIELDHINGNHYDNSLSNLRILCPNCHALTPTNSGKNRKVVKKIYTCSKCDKAVYKHSKCCKECDNLVRIGKRTKIIWPSIESLLQDLQHMSYTALAKKLGVSDNSIRKHIKTHGSMAE